MNAAHEAARTYASRQPDKATLRLPTLADDATAGTRETKSGRLVALAILLGLSVSLLCMAGGISHIYQDKGIPAKIRTKISKPINEISFALVLLSVAQAVYGIALLIKSKPSTCATQSKEVSEALENLSVSRIIRKRDSLSAHELLKLVQEQSLELKQAKTFQRYLIEKASHVVCILDAKGNFLSVSRASLSAWGYPNQELEGQCLCDYIEDAARVFSGLMSVAGTNGKVEVQSKLIARDGELLDIVWTAYWSKSDNALFCVAQDFTERNRTERERREFIAMVTHDLRTPISSFHCILELLNNGVLGSLDERGKRLVNNVSRDFGRLERLISDMLDIERAESAHALFECDMVSLDEIVTHAADLVAVQANNQGIKVNVSGPSVSAWGDRDQLMRVVLNLLGNAVKFSPDNSVIEVRLDDADDMVRVSVVDCGPGISAERLNRVFDKFETEKLSAAKRAGGTGLGLAICKAIVRNHGGEIGVFSQVGHGSEFWFTVPKERKPTTSGSQPVVGQPDQASRELLSA